MENRPDLKVCGAKTKDGTPCQKLPCATRTRCRLHGGASPKGIGHPNFKHGYYSDSITGVLLRAQVKEARRIDRFMLKQGARWDEDKQRWTFLPPTG
ncbi:MAG: HGGxSTG domain-containing protein [Armatimonadota bacterium]